MNREEIERLLPHRAPMLLLDSVELTDGEAVGTYAVPEDAFFVKGHFPNNPVVPGVMLCEMMGQSSCALLGAECAGKTPYFTGMDKVKFKHKVVPGDVVTTRSRLVKSRSPFYFIEARAFVGDVLCATAELSFALLEA
jgi:3-hydroxyacyl-[acyl-carrier-protein] dehydratase